ncbi:hypothetical protein HY635_03875 [Candidatus Uhrbacteria bacterium]|nr:hypothetical protein [Candidatus Uhrbacteria bacterium]
MPEQFLALTRAAGLPLPKAPPPPVTAPPLGARGGAGELPPPPKAPPPSVAPAAPTPSEISNLKSQIPQGPGIPMEEGKRKMIVIWGAVGGVILIGGGLAAFFALRSVKPPTPPAPRPINVPPVNIVPVNVPPVNIAPPAPEPEPEPEPPPAADKDTDADGLTDAEELLLGTDIGLADSDRDGYSDSIELANLYNPAGVAPQRILDAGLVYEYEHPTAGWSIYLPRAWSIAATDQEQQELLVTTQASGEGVAIHIGLQPECAAREGGPDLGDELQTKRGAVGFRVVAASSGAPLVCFRLSADRYIALEHRASNPPRRYPQLFDMLVQSVAVSAPNIP